jgi:mono/diheme cytochrome c family protein
MPYTAKVKAGGKERAMIGAVSTGACNSCHTKTGGSTGAPGRILIPGV